MSDGLIEDEFADRPDDDALAFLHYEKMFRAPLDEPLERLQRKLGDNYWNAYNHHEQTYINSVLATVSELNPDMLERWVNNPRKPSCLYENRNSVRPASPQIVCPSRRRCARQSLRAYQQDQADHRRHRHTAGA